MLWRKKNNRSTTKPVSNANKDTNLHRFMSCHSNANQTPSRNEKHIALRGECGAVQIHSFPYSANIGQNLFSRQSNVEQDFAYCCQPGRIGLCYGGTQKPTKQLIVLMNAWMIEWMITREINDGKIQNVFERRERQARFLLKSHRYR